MADRYWVGGTETWNATAGSKWALTSGGTGGQAVPTSSDDVYFDATSGAVTITQSGGRVCNNFTTTGFTGTFAGSGGLTVSGSMLLGSGMTWTNTGNVTFNATATGKTVTTNGISLGNSAIFNGVGGGWTLQDALTLPAGPVTLTNGALVTNDVAVTATSLSSNNSNARELTLGASVITLTGTNGVNCGTATNLTLDAGTSTIKLTAAGTVLVNIGGTAGDGLTLNNLWNAKSDGGAFNLSGGNTWNDIKIDAGQTFNPPISKTTTISSLTVPNSSSNAISFSSNGTGTAALSKASGTVTVKGCTITDITATGGATFTSLTSDGNVDGGGNTGWDFGTPAFQSAWARNSNSIIQVGV